MFWIALPKAYAAYAGFHNKFPYVPLSRYSKADWLVLGKNINQRIIKPIKLVYDKSDEQQIAVLVSSC